MPTAAGFNSTEPLGSIWEELLALRIAPLLKSYAGPSKPTKGPAPTAFAAAGGSPGSKKPLRRRNEGAISPTFMDNPRIPDKSLKADFG
jgi:hypothetical protein